MDEVLPRSNHEIRSQLYINLQCAVNNHGCSFVWGYCSDINHVFISKLNFPQNVKKVFIKKSAVHKSLCIL